MFNPTLPIQFSKIHILSFNDDILLIHWELFLRGIVIIELATT